MTTHPSHDAPTPAASPRNPFARALDIVGAAVIVIGLMSVLLGIALTGRGSSGLAALPILGAGGLILVAAAVIRGIGWELRNRA